MKIRLYSIKMRDALDRNNTFASSTCKIFKGSTFLIHHFCDLGKVYVIGEYLVNFLVFLDESVLHKKAAYVKIMTLF